MLSSHCSSVHFLSIQSTCYVRYESLILALLVGAARRCLSWHVTRAVMCDAVWRCDTWHVTGCDAGRWCNQRHSEMLSQAATTSGDYNNNTFISINFADSIFRQPWLLAELHIECICNSQSSQTTSQWWWEWVWAHDLGHIDTKHNSDKINNFCQQHKEVRHVHVNTDKCKIYKSEDEEARNVSPFFSSIRKVTFSFPLISISNCSPLPPITV